MSPFESNYISKTPDANGYINYIDEEHSVWSELYTRQIKIIENRAYQDYIDGLTKLKLNPEQIPQLPDIDIILKQHTGWSIQAVPALISNQKFYQLLSEKKFPVATFIRRREELDYLQEPDIFHEFFGHCPLITSQPYADFMEKYGKLALQASDKQLAKLARLYWFTIEFGLISTDTGLRTYGGGILSSKQETVYCIDSDIPERRKFCPLTIFRTPYRIDILQTVYYVIDSLEQLFQSLDENIFDLIEQSNQLGDLPKTFPIGNADIY